jgi:hypothetical protein
MRFKTKAAIIVGNVVLGAVALAGPAFAAGNPVAVTANVGQTISMTGPPASLALNGDPGTTASANVNYKVTTNDASGYSVQITPGGTSLVNGGSVIANSAMGYVPDGGSQLQFSGATPLTVNNKNSISGTGGDSYTDTFNLAIPGNAPSGAYAETFSYLVVAK